LPPFVWVVVLHLERKSFIEWAERTTVQSDDSKRSSRWRCVLHPHDITSDAGRRDSPRTRHSYGLDFPNIPIDDGESVEVDQVPKMAVPHDRGVRRRRALPLLSAHDKIDDHESRANGRLLDRPNDERNETRRQVGHVEESSQRHL